MKCDSQLFIRTIFILVLTVSGSVYSGERILPQGATPVDPSRLNNGALSLPAIKGTVEAPGPGWTWFQGPTKPKDIEYYYCVGNETQLFAVVLNPGFKQIRSAKVEFFTKDVEGLVSASNGSILSEKGEFISMPAHPEVFHMTSHVLMGEREMDYERYLIPAGTHMVMFCAVPFSEPDRLAFQTFASTLRYSSTNKADRSIFLYFFFGAVFYALGFGANVIFSRKLISPALFALIGIFITCSVRLILHDSGYLRPRAGMNKEVSQGYEMGLALIPFLILVFLCWWEKRVERIDAARALAQKQLEAIEANELAASEGEARQP